MHFLNHHDKLAWIDGELKHGGGVIGGVLAITGKLFMYLCHFIGSCWSMEETKARCLMQVISVLRVLKLSWAAMGMDALNAINAIVKREFLVP